MKVAITLGDLNRGGTETLALDTLANRKDAAFDMICIHRKGGQLEDKFYSCGAKVIKCQPKRFRLVSYLLRLRGILNSESVDLVHSQQFIDTIYARLASIGKSRQIVETFHGYYGFDNRIEKMLVRLSIAFSDKVIFVSKALRDEYIQYYKLQNISKLFVVYNGIDFSKFDGITKDTENHERLQLAMTGNFWHIKDQMTICRFCKRLSDAGIKYDMHFIGRKVKFEPEAYDNCVNYCKANGIEESVHFLGDCNNVQELLSKMDAFVFSSRLETFGIAVIEAIALGIPTFVNDLPCLVEISKNGRYATIYKSTDDSDLLEKFITTLDGRRRESKSQNLIEEIQTEYNIQNFLSNLNIIYLK